MNTILLATDFTAASEDAFDAAVALAKRMSSSLALVHIISPPANLTAIATELVETESVSFARAQIDRLVDTAKKHGISTISYLQQDNAVYGLLQAIEKLQPEMVVVGSHGRRGLRRALIGSVSDQLCRRSPVPVLVVPASRRRAHFERAAWACANCGHIVGRSQSSNVCVACGAEPAKWQTAPVTDLPADVDEPAVGDNSRDEIASERANSPTGLFATSPGGTEGYDVNPELRVRY